MSKLAKSILLELNDSYRGLSPETRAYVLSLFSLLTIFLINKLFLDSKDGTSLYWISLSILLYGFYQYLKSMIPLAWETISGKLIVSIGSVLITTFCLSLANQIINTALSAPSSPFVYTQSILSVLIAPLAISFIAGLVGIFAIPLAAIVYMSQKAKISVKSIFMLWIYKTPPEDEEASDLNFVARVVAIISLVSLCFSFNNDNKWYTDQLESFSRWYVYNFEMEAFSHCNLSTDEKVSYINKDVIVVGVELEKTYKFKTRKCIYVAP